MTDTAPSELERLQIEFADLTRIERARYQLCEALSDVRDKLSHENNALRKEVQAQQDAIEREKARVGIAYKDWEEATAYCVLQLGGEPGDLLLPVIDRVVSQATTLRNALIRIEGNYSCLCSPRHEGGCLAFIATKVIRETEPKNVHERYERACLREPESRMTAADHSVMVYLLDCIECCPHRATDLLAIAGARKASEKFREYVSRLTTHVGHEGGLLGACHTIRESIR